MPRVALIRGPYLRPDGVRPWEYLHEQTDYDVVAFESSPPRFDTSDLQIPVQQLSWPDGMIDAFGYDHFVSRAIRHVRFPSDYLVGISEVCDNFDIVNTSENFNLFSLQAAIACRSRQAEFVFSAGENIPYPLFQHNPILWFIKRFVNSTATAITTTTPVGKRALIHEGVDHDKINVIPNAVDSKKFQPKENVDPSTFSLPCAIENKPTILFVHSLCEQKGVPYLLKAFEKIRMDFDTQLILVGESDLNKETEQELAADTNIHWLKSVPYESMPDLYGLADIFVLPSVTMVNNEEQFGMAALEAMACGLPTIVTETGGLPYVAEDGESSIVVPERSPPELAEALCKLLDSPRLREQLGSNGRKRSQEVFSASNVGESLRKCYDEVLNR